MSDYFAEPFSDQARLDFQRARFKAFVNRLWGTPSGQPITLLSYDEIKEKLHIGGPIYRGLQTVRVEQIAGSLNRYHEFDRVFLPASDKLATRWQSVNLTPDIRLEDLEILGTKVNFLERTSLDSLRPDADIKVTILDGFDRMLEHIAVHRYFMGIDWKRGVSEEEAVTHWYDTVYMPVVQVIRDTSILEGFPGKTEGDLYLWALDHQRFLVEDGVTLQPPETAARIFVDDGVKKPARKTRSDKGKK